MLIIMNDRSSSSSSPSPSPSSSSSSPSQSPSPSPSPSHHHHHYHHHNNHIYNIYIYMYHHNCCKSHYIPIKFSFNVGSPPNQKNAQVLPLSPGCTCLSLPSSWCMCLALPASDAAPFEGILRQLGATAKKDQL